MKKYILSSLAVLSATLFMTSCNDMLDTDPRVTEMTAATFPGKPADVEAEIAAIYSIMNTMGGGDSDNQNIFFWWEVMSDDCYGSGGLQDNKVKSLHHLVEMSVNQYETPFILLYGGISRANSTIETIDNVAWAEKQKGLRDQLLGEAYFMRGLYYLWLSQLYGDVPLITSTVITPEMLQQVSAEVSLIQEVYEQFCLVYEYNAKNCPSVIDFIDHNRISLSSYISGKSKDKEKDYTVAAQFVDFCKKIPAIYLLLCNLYLGSVITCYLEFKPQEVKMNVDLLLDTNFIISLLDLNTEESTKTCKKLMEITKSIGYTYHVLIDTIEETQSLLRFKSRIFNTDVIYKFINKEDVISACERMGYNDSDLDRIADNLEDTLLKMGIQILYNTSHLDGKARYSSEYSILKSKRNTSKAALHDAKAIYYVKEKRGKKIDTFEESNCWFVNNSITHDNDRDSIETLLNENNKGGMPEIIRADDLLNILWLSNPQIDMDIANSELSDIGLTSLVSLTLNKSLPKAHVIRDLDENIQKYRTEDVTDRDVLMLSTRIINLFISFLLYSLFFTSFFFNPL